MATSRVPTAYLGTFIYSKTQEELEYLHNTAVFVDEKGKIVAIEKDVDESSVKNTLSKLGWKPDTPLHMCKGEQFFFPGFIGIFSLLCPGF